MSKPPKWKWSTVWEALRWRGPLLFSLLVLREVFRPLVYWHVFYVFETDLGSQPAPKPYTGEKVDVRVYECPGDLERATAEITSMGQLERAEVDSRFKRGDKALIAYVGGEPIGYGWLSFTCGVVELAFGVTWIVGPHEAIRYDSFVLPKWRGRRIHSCLHSAKVAYAREHGIHRTLDSTSSLNRQSMRLAKHYRRRPIMKVTLLHVPALDWTIHKAAGASFESRFLKRSQQERVNRSDYNGENSLTPHR